MAIRFPLGNDNFAELRENGDYYVDKTNFIKELLSQSFKAKLVTRPRRFGKTLTLSMLEDFFDISRDSTQDVEGMQFEQAYQQWKALISDFCIEHEFLGKSETVNAADRAVFWRFVEKKATGEEDQNAFFYLIRMMNTHYGKPVILLIDEYDVPLSKANENGYYRDQQPSG